MVVHNQMTSQERVRLAKRLHRHAKDPVLSSKERSIAFSHIRKLMLINMAVALRELFEGRSPKSS